MSRVDKELTEDEPLLRENKHRFVLFPIQFPRVSFARQRVQSTFRTLACSVSPSALSRDILAGLGYVQEGRSFVLDGRGD